MLDLARRALLTGVGLGLIAKDKIDEAIQKIREENDLTEDESRRLAKELLDQSEDARKRLNDLIEKTTAQILSRLDIPSRKDFSDLEKRLEKLEELVKKETSDAS